MSRWIASLVALSVVLGWSSTSAYGDEEFKPTAFNRLVQPLETVRQVQPPPIDLLAVQDEDVVREAEGLAPRFAIPHPVYLTPANSGTWEELDGNTMFWRLRITSPGATSINLGFARYSMPVGGRLFIYAADGSFILRPFTSEDNAAHGELWTPVCMSDDIVVEVTIPAPEVPALELELSSINHGYRGFEGLLSKGKGDDGGPRSGSCNIDVVCPQGDPWQLDIPAVAVISTGGSTFCTGFMVNDTVSDLRPFFMTANHCGVTSGNAASLVTYWNYYNSWCRPPGSPESGGPGDGSLSQFNTGSFFRSSYATSDFTLVELDSDPDPAWNISYAGWDRTGGNPLTGACIHHPNTDEKRITFFDPLYHPSHGSSWGCSPYPGPGDNTHIRVYWSAADGAVTEPGSSGSPLFDDNHRVIGQLHGGPSACGATGDNLSDCYGRISTSWTGGGSNSTRLSNWLDAAGTGATTADTVSLATLCSDAGTVELDRPKYACDGVVNVEVVDCGLNADPNLIETVTITVSSSSEPAGESVLLTETQPDTARFQGSVELSTTNSPGIVQVAEGDTITATYNDADDGTGQPAVATDTASVDCTAPIISNVQIVDVQPRSATISFDANEPVLGSVLYGLSCASLPSKVTATGYSTSVTVEVTGLQDNTTYYFAASGEDEAGNTGVNDNGGNCYTFATPEIPDYFTEEFGADNDLDNVSLIFVTGHPTDFYSGCVEPITSLPTDPTGGTTLSLSDDSNVQVTIGSGETAKLYGTSYGAFFVGSNGYITFNTGDTDYTETLADHFNRPRLSACFDDLNPSAGGTVSWKQLADRVAVTYLNVAEYSTTNQNTFQIEMFFDGKIVISYLSVAVTDGIAGLSQGAGIPPDFYESDLSNMGACGPKPPTAENGSASTPLNTPVLVTLSATDDGLPNPPAALSYVIASLPANGSLSDPNGGAIGGIPYTLLAGGNQVTYTPAFGSLNPDSFQFKANDGGTPPEGGDSNTATVSITITPPLPQQVYFFPLDTNPGWSTEGSWAWGDPTGGGTHNHDPQTGYTGNNVYGYNLSGDYTNNMPVRYLTTTALDCAELVDTELRFRRWLGVESSAFDHANLEVSSNGTTWTTVWDHSGGTIAETSWSYQTYDISAVADGASAVYLRWGMGPTDGGTTYPGWNIDDIEIWARVIPQAPVCANALGDMDGLNGVDGEDIDEFTACYIGDDVAVTGCVCADMNVSGGFEPSDVTDFVNCLLGIVCP